MLRETRYKMDYPSKTVIEDLIDRTGKPDENSFTPFDGKAWIIQEQFSGTQADQFSMYEFKKHIAGRDFNPTVVKIRKRDGGLESNEGELAGFRNLEDVVAFGHDNVTIDKYIIMLCVSFKKDAGSSYRQHKNYQYVQVFENPDDGETETEAEQLLKESDGDLDPITRENTLNELAYIIKILWNQSKKYQCNLFSFALVYAEIIKSRHKYDVRGKDFKDTDIYMLYRNNSGGARNTRRFVYQNDHTTAVYNQGISIFTTPGSYQVPYGLCEKFLACLRVLGIDPKQIDPLQFNDEFVRSILCTYLPNNNEYIELYSKGDYKLGVDPEIMLAIQSGNIYTKSRESLYINNMTNTDDAGWDQKYWHIGKYLSNEEILWRCGRPKDDLFIPKPEETKGLILKYMQVMSGKFNVRLPESCGFRPDNHIFYLSKEIKGANGRTVHVQDCLHVPGKFFGTLKGNTDYEVVFTDYGFIIPLDDDTDDRMFYMTLENCLERLGNYNGNTGPERNEEFWKCFGNDS